MPYEDASGEMPEGSREGSKNSVSEFCMSMCSIWLSRLGEDECE